MTALWRGRLSAGERRRATAEIMAVVVDTKAPTMPPPAKSCSSCGGRVDAHAWMANATRRAWPELGLEIEECPHGCASTLATKVNALPLVTR